MNPSKERSCDGKVRHDTELLAVREIRALIATGRVRKWELKPYKCQYCNGWHAGHAKRKLQAMVEEIIKSRKPSQLIRMKQKD